MFMRANGVGNHTEHDSGNSPAFPARAQEIVKETIAEIRRRPVLATAAAGTLGVVLGGLIVPTWGRLAFVAAVGYFANELWRREARVDIDRVMASLSGDLTEKSQA